MKYIVGAYASAPSLVNKDENQEIRFYQQLIESIQDLKGLEIPFWGNNIHCFGDEFLLKIIDPSWDNVLSCIPGTMLALEKSPNFGLASNVPEARKDAVAMHKRANSLLHKMNQRYGRQSIIAVQIATAPSVPVEGVSSSLESLSDSLDEILSWDWGGARIVIEHCDASIEGKPFIKGFLPLSSEIEIIERFSKKYNVGILINWARSAIEGKSAESAMQHVKLANQNNLLAGLIFSGVSSDDDEYGIWKDTHMPFAQSYEIEYYAEKSLLTKENLMNTLNLVNIETLDYLGIKLLSMPMDKSTIQRRVGINVDAITVLKKILL